MFSVFQLWHISESPRIIVRNQSVQVNINLSDNKLTNIPSYNITNVEALDLSNNILSVAEADDLLNIMGAVKCLNFSNNNIANITAFQLLPTENSWTIPLNQLDLSHNLLTSISDFVFINLVNLHYLDLSYNQFTEIDNKTNHAIGSLKALNHLRLSHCHLSSLPEDLMQSFDKLTSLDLSGNYFRQVDSSLRLAGTLTNLILDNNLIETLNHDSLHGLDKLQTLSIRKI